MSSDHLTINPNDDELFNPDNKEDVDIPSADQKQLEAEDCEYDEFDKKKFISSTTDALNILLSSTLINQENSSNNENSIWVTGLLPTAKAADLKDLFSKYGKVIDIKVISTSTQPDSKCFGLVTMSNSEEAKSCLDKLNNTTFDDNVITLSMAEKDITKPPGEIKTKPIEAINSEISISSRITHVEKPKMMGIKEKKTNSYISKAFAQKLARDAQLRKTSFYAKKRQMYIKRQTEAHSYRLKQNHSITQAGTEYEGSTFRKPHSTSYHQKDENDEQAQEGGERIAPARRQQPLSHYNREYPSYERRPFRSRRPTYLTSSYRGRPNFRRANWRGAGGSTSYYNSNYRARGRPYGQSNAYERSSHPSSYYHEHGETPISSSYRSRGRGFRSAYRPRGFRGTTGYQSYVPSSSVFNESSTRLRYNQDRYKNDSNRPSGERYSPAKRFRGSTRAGLTSNNRKSPQHYKVERVSSRPEYTSTRRPGANYSDEHNATSYRKRPFAQDSLTTQQYFDARAKKPLLSSPPSDPYATTSSTYRRRKLDSGDLPRDSRTNTDNNNFSISTRLDGSHRRVIRSSQRTSHSPPPTYSHHAKSTFTQYDDSHLKRSLHSQSSEERSRDGRKATTYSGGLLSQSKGAPYEKSYKYVSDRDNNDYPVRRKRPRTPSTPSPFTKTEYFPSGTKQRATHYSLNDGTAISGNSYNSKTSGYQQDRHIKTFRPSAGGDVYEDGGRMYRQPHIRYERSPTHEVMGKQSDHPPYSNTSSRYNTESYEFPSSRYAGRSRARGYGTSFSSSNRYASDQGERGSYRPVVRRPAPYNTSDTAPHRYEDGSKSRGRRGGYDNSYTSRSRGAPRGYPAQNRYEGPGSYSGYNKQQSSSYRQDGRTEGNRGGYGNRTEQYVRSDTRPSYRKF